MRYLKNAGYKTHLYSSAQLNYYGMENLLFGKDNALLNTYATFRHIAPLTAADTDAKALDALLGHVKEDPSLHEGQIFLIFWDSTHFDYSWPKTWAPKFVPFAGDFAYFKAFYSAHRIHLIKNRYRNAVHYVDHLFGKFLASVPDQENAVIVVTGDHGEEFFEHGHLFHGSHLVEQQTCVPIFMKFGKDSPAQPREMITQMDIFPSIIDYVTGIAPTFLRGESVFRSQNVPYAVISRFNGGITPYEFCLHNGRNKLIAQFSDRKNIWESDSIRITSLQTKEDKTIADSHKNVSGWIEKEFGNILNRM